MKRWTKFVAAAFCAFGLTTAANAQILVTPDTSSVSLAAAVTAGGTGGITVTGSSLSSHTLGALAGSGTFTAGANAYGLGASGIVISSGAAASYSTGPNTSGGFTGGSGLGASAAREVLLDPITGGGFTHFDVTQLDITFDAGATTTAVFFNVVFGSEEWAEFVGTSFIDGFGLYLNGVNIAFTGGFPVNINHPDMISVPETELDGILAPGGSALLTFSGAVVAGSVGNTLTFIIADASDSSLDTTAYISSLGDAPPQPQIPEPASLTLLSLGLVGVLGYSWRKRKAA